MKKFSDLDNFNEEFLTFFKSPKKDEYIKSSSRLIETYAKNLVEDSFLRLHPHEKDKFDFDMYKIKSITKDDVKKFTVVVSTYTEAGEFVDDVIYKISTE